MNVCARTPCKLWRPFSVTHPLLCTSGIQKVQHRHFSCLADYCAAYIVKRCLRARSPFFSIYGHSHIKCRTLTLLFVFARGRLVISSFWLMYWNFDSDARRTSSSVSLILVFQFSKISMTRARRVIFSLVLLGCHREG